MGLKQCSGCGKETLHKFCSDTCKIAWKAAKQTMENEKAKFRICRFCGKRFLDSFGRQFYCSEKCKQSKKDLTHISRPTIGNKLRFSILTRDNFACRYCGRSVKEDNIKLVIDHIIPTLRGGKTKENNLITACEECNYGKSDLLLSEDKLSFIQALLC